MVNKHKKLKLVDPECKREILPLSKSKQYNCVPTDLEKQEVPRKMMDFIDLKNNHLRNMLRQRKKKKRHNGSVVVHKPYIGEELPGMTRPVQKIPEVMAQRENESVSHFLGRIQDLANMHNSQAKIESKFGIGEPAELEFGIGKVQRGSRKKEKRKLFKNKQKERKKRKFEVEDDFSFKKEHIPFGEIAMAPPVLTGLKKMKQEIQKPGMRNLLLKSSYSSKTEDSDRKSKASKECVDSKRKVELEAARNEAVELYRKIKAKKQARFQKL